MGVGPSFPAMAHRDGRTVARRDALSVTRKAGQKQQAERREPFRLFFCVLQRAAQLLPRLPSVLSAMKRAPFDPALISSIQITSVAGNCVVRVHLVGNFIDLIRSGGSHVKLQWKTYLAASTDLVGSVDIATNGRVIFNPVGFSDLDDG